MPVLGRVRYLKAVEGVAAPGEILGGTRRIATLMQRMWDDIAGTDDAVALYIKRDPRSRYNPHDPSSPHLKKYRPEHVAAILWMSPQGAKRSVFDFTEDAQYEIGCPVAAVDDRCGPRLKDLVMRECGASAPDVWRRLPGSLVGGKPFRIDVGDYAPIGEALTRFYAVAAPPLA